MKTAIFLVLIVLSVSAQAHKHPYGAIHTHWDKPTTCNGATPWMCK